MLRLGSAQCISLVLCKSRRALLFLLPLQAFMNLVMEAPAPYPIPVLLSSVNPFPPPMPVCCQVLSIPKPVSASLITAPNLQMKPQYTPSSSNREPIALMDAKPKLALIFQGLLPGLGQDLFPQVTTVISY